MVHLIDGEEREKIPVKTHFKSARFSAVIKDGNEWSGLHTRKNTTRQKMYLRALDDGPRLERD